MELIRLKNQSGILVLLCSFFMLFLSGFFGKAVLYAMAKPDSVQKYYTDITIREGDSLWSIADTYCHEGGVSIEDYIYELSRINHLSDSDIHIGQKLIVVYYERTAEEKLQN
ncbi:MAG: LysM peptidoglycan-binding domain-containing protein [bacterium]|nr:LysM peptidoglycan-binding domain-containing protein [bacterium]